MTDVLRKNVAELASSMRHSAGTWMVPGWDGHKVADLLTILLGIIDACPGSRHSLSPADSIPRRPCKSCRGTMVGEVDQGECRMSCVQCRAKEGV